MLVPDELTLEEAENRITEALGIIYSYGQLDGAHHRMWVIDQVVRKLMGSEEDYNDWVADYQGDSEDGANYYYWDTGICP